MNPLMKRSLMLLGTLVALVALSFTAQAQTLSGGTAGVNGDIFVINEDETTGYDAAVRFQARQSDGDHVHWINWADNSTLDMYWQYLYSSNASGKPDATSTGTTRMKLTESGLLYLYGSGDARLYMYGDDNDDAYTLYYANGTSSNEFRVGMNSSYEGYFWNNQPGGVIKFGTKGASSSSTSERMRVDADGNLLLGTTGTASGKLHVAGDGYFTSTVRGTGFLFGNTEGTSFGTWSGSAYSTAPEAGTMMYDANWDEESNDPEYNTAAYFVDGSGADEDLGGMSFWGGNATAEWEHLLTTYNMRYLMGDMYSLDLDQNLTIGGNSTVAGTLDVAGKTTLNDDFLTVGSITAQNSTTSTNYLVMGHGGSNAYMSMYGTGNLDFRYENNTYMQLTSAGKLGVGGDFNPSYGLEVRGDGYFDEALTANSTLTVGGMATLQSTVDITGATTIGASGADANLTVYGQARVKELYIDPTNTWADYVFAEGYNLPSLAEVKSFIDQNGHLPGIMSAEEVATEGYAQTEVNALLLSKVEELTLYMIEMEERNAELEKSNAELRAMVEALVALQQNEK